MFRLDKGMTPSNCTVAAMIFILTVYITYFMSRQGKQVKMEGRYWFSVSTVSF